MRFFLRICKKSSTFARFFIACVIRAYANCARKERKTTQKEYAKHQKYSNHRTR